MSIKQHPRLITEIIRGTPRYQKLLSLRPASERINSAVKEYLEILLKTKSSRAMSVALTRRISRYPTKLRLSITYNNVPENAEHTRTNKILGTCPYFCEPFHSYERGTVENTIGLVRRFLPKKTNLAKISQDRFTKIEYWLNNRPRKCLGFKTPAEVFKAECCT